MKRLFAITSAVLIACTSLAVAQQAASTTRPLAEVAKQEEERRKTVRKPAKVYTNGNLRADISAGVAAPPSATTPAGGNASPSNATPTAPAAAAAPPADQAAWAARMKTARDNLQRSQMFADSLQSRINALQTDFVNRDDPAQRSKIEQDRNAALAELEKVKKELVDQAKAIKDIEEEARRAGVPSGWLRPGA